MVPGWMQLALVALVALLLFGGRGKISAIMGDMAKGIRSFRTGLKDEDEDDKKPEPINVTPEKDKA
jgi:Sec-independent protein secretion pathway components|tara:strand:+ start:49 stop:246 length:198 start_codon:yes stop_codon:yes gene_type:complete